MAHMFVRRVCLFDSSDYLSVKCWWRWTALRFESNQSQPNVSQFESEEHEFRTLSIIPKRRERKERKWRQTTEITGARYKRMAANQDWPSVWPSARTFHPSTVPLPLFMGYVDPTKSRNPVNKFYNTELIKIPNFLHLSPPAIKRHCQALKMFCTQWPEELDSDEKCEQHFPVEVTTTDFVFSNTSIRWPDARHVTVKVKLSALPLDYHAIDKMKRLLMERYDKNKDEIVLNANRCPMRKQNYDYAMYLLTALFFESWKTEKWESDKSELDWEKFYWDKSRSKQSIVKYMKDISPDLDEHQILENEKIKDYAQAVCKLNDEGENADNLDNYKKTVLQLIF